MRQLSQEDKQITFPTPEIPEQAIAGVEVSDTNSRCG